MAVQYTDDPNFGSDFCDTQIHLEFEAEDWAEAKQKVQNVFSSLVDGVTATVTNDPSTR